MGVLTPLGYSNKKTLGQKDTGVRSMDQCLKQKQFKMAAFRQPYL